jgi:hypothetical protein
MKKHTVITKKYEDSPDHPGYFCCAKCGLFMGLRHGVMDGTDYSRLDQVYGEDGECPGKPIGDVIIRGFRDFWISPNYGGDIRSSIRRLYGGSGHLSVAEKINQTEFEAEFGPCLGIRVLEGGGLEAVTDKYIVYVHEYDGLESLQCVERTPDWFAELTGA